MVLQVLLPRSRCIWLCEDDLGSHVEAVVVCKTRPNDQVQERTLQCRLRRATKDRLPKDSATVLLSSDGEKVAVG